jgi:predicted lipid-binding transport protein (Tim44 family)
MKNSLKVLICVLALGLASMDADAARRFGGGGNLGKQRPAPTMKEAAPSAAPAAPTATKPGQAAPAAATPGAPAPKPSFMSRWGGLLAGLGIGALLASMFGAHMGPAVGMLLMVLLLAAIGFMAFRFFASRKEPLAERKPVAFAGIGSGLEAPRVEPTMGASSPGGTVSTQSFAGSPPIDIPGFEVEPFVRVAKTSFIRMQAANDAGDLDDIRDFTTPEMYAEIAMQLGERGAAGQKTEVVSLDASVIEAVVEDGYAIASVRFWGLMREAPDANPEPFDEVWHVRKNLKDRSASWLISGIQQTQQAA